VSFSDLEGKLSRHPSAFNRYCRNVAGRELSHRLPLGRVADSEQKPGSATTEPVR
jgi:hypothetical protein